MSGSKDAYRPLIQGVSQFEVDFVVPRIGADVPLGIDPFLLFKSRDPQLRELHDHILNAFAAGVQALKTGRKSDARILFQFPEVPEIGMGYTKSGKRGSGVGDFLSALIIETLNESPAILDRGITHLEEMQLISLGIGPDRVSDIAASLIKPFLIEYTQKQCHLWDIPTIPGVPITHIFNNQTLSWEDGYFDLPVSSFDNAAILLVPRRIVRSLPWINYDDFYKLEFAPYLRAKAVARSLSHASLKLSPQDKQKVISVTRKEVQRIDHYVKIKEESAANAQPSTPYAGTDDPSAGSAALLEKLRSIPRGADHASAYQKLILEILNYLFNPELIDGELEVRTVDGTERRDIIFTNDSDKTFWDYIRTEHSSLFLMFETKNTDSIGADALNQTATYMGDRLGRVGFIVTREAPGDAQQRKAFSIYNDSHPRKIILFLSDQDIARLLEDRRQGKDTMRYIQTLYRKFRTRVQ